jgi:hypothetical protein
MLSKPTRLDTIGAPHEAIVVRTARGPMSVYLDTGVSTPAPEEHKDSSALPSPDARFSAVVELPKDMLAEGEYQIAITSAADGTVMRHRVPKPQWPGYGRDPQWTAATVAYPGQSLFLDRWSADGQSLWFYYGGKVFRMVVATGAIDAEPPPVQESLNVRDCPARKRRLILEVSHERQSIVLEEAESRRTLVTATAPDWHPHQGGSPPARIGDLAFSRSCDHFLFAYDAAVYVGNVATGQFAFLIAGRL